MRNAVEAMINVEFFNIYIAHFRLKEETQLFFNMVKINMGQKNLSLDTLNF